MHYCPLGKGICRHCSDEVLVEFKHVGVIKTQLMERIETRIKLGLWCNNDGRHYVRELKSCPAIDALTTPIVPREPDLVAWMKKFGG